MPKVTMKKFEGDDRHSWAIFVNGSVKMTGLSKTEAEYYKKVITKNEEEKKNGKS